ncbi:ATPase with chaperone activity, ATP-binding subunit [Candidatus Uzinura diaspidicola str. ASNER]|uniref:ATPase with chaperone activity, ATP-binding subunit n=1 Tax=Candidatus Uzinura diaspidicola str. ASNER TaxID=1133592 RepID=L7VJW8_9FLAO|nr:ATPase with chaperone activity, ATP-binding subunit [Candidatus Uzinura diaspidicola str. ASNER]
MRKNFSLTLKEVLGYSNKEAFLLGHGEMSTEHLILGIYRMGEGKAIEIFYLLQVDLQQVKKKIDIKDNFRHLNLENKICRIEMTQQVERILNTTFLEAKIFKFRVINTAHLLLSILRDENDPVTKILSRLEINYDKFMQKVNIQNYYQNPKITESFRQSDFLDYKNKIISTPVLDNFCRDLTLMALQGKIDQVVGREKEVERICQILSRMKKNNPLLIGEPGVGKTAIAEGLAYRIVKGKVSRLLYQRKIFMLDLPSLVAGTKFRGQFEERIKACMNELLNNKDIILFIDEIHTIIGAGGAQGSLDASNIFKPALAKGELQCIGATTLDEYREYIERDGALSRRFQNIIIDPTSSEETIVILNKIKTQYENHHNVLYTDKAIEACVNLTKRYISDRYFPDKAIDALDEAGTIVNMINIKIYNDITILEKKIKCFRDKKYKMIKNNNYEEAVQLMKKEKKIEKELIKAKRNWEKTSKDNSEMVNEKNVAQVVSMMTGIPIGRLVKSEIKKLINMSELIKKRIIGQDEAVEKTIRAIQRNRAGLKDPARPIGIFIFLGQTGVGKTQLAKIIAQEFFDSEDALIRIDMSEYMEKNSVSRLIGAPPGYVGYEEGGQLTEAVRRKPYSVILLDELEKAHSDIFNLLLQVMDDGNITDSYGKKIDFRNTIIIFTSNIGTREFTEFGKGVGYETSYEKNYTDHYLNNSIKTKLKEVFSPEFINRIDDIIIFNSLKRRDICMILDLELNKIINRMFELGYTLHLSKDAKTFIADKGYDKNHGARPLKRALQKFVEDLISENIIHENISKGDSLFLRKNKNKILLSTLKNLFALVFSFFFSSSSFVDFLNSFNPIPNPFISSVIFLPTK